jgi:hypothetical protein
MAISSMLGWVAAVSATESPSQLRPALIQRTWTSGSAAASVSAGWAVFGAVAIDLSSFTAWPFGLTWAHVNGEPEEWKRHALAEASARAAV